MRLCVFASGTGSNFEAIYDAIEQGRIHATLDLCVCDNPQAAIIQKAQARGVDTFVFNPKDYPNKKAYETQILEQLKSHAIDFIALAGYMRLIGKTLLQAYPQKIINIHPSLLPKYKGLDALGQALQNNDTLLGASIHYVDESLDGGAIIQQQSFRCYQGQPRSEIEAELHRIEHKLYVSVLETISQENKL
ncbi:phosphoribosylglycinamide formyltransferase [Erysipelothrix larvae]|uniref:Phosphoribosylglycinamide formyltransferase n=1 Tax=Erysipelothrix larvae TaxID=1514105 RepID=A0A0X8H0Q3_9FIRM|nr:phosphoribosylglycinamide formyltransferase [Erysipelothrix larvae]AMC93875.1 phosphoribosylglycinamide formyltransferase [Erysipelothrix larvae]